jgi:Asp-tRNA(Asn)/Glu-tRNA(Gln) amidotransferase A subunit family amidase
MSNETQSVREIVELIKSGAGSSEKYTSQCSKLIEQSDTVLKAWRYLDSEQALKAARSRDDERKAGRPLGALQGIPVGVKDIFDTADMPTEYGNVAYEGNQPAQHSAVVENLIEAGAIVMGKTVTTEYAFMHPAVTCNPLNHAHTPGGSSSGSAAAVAAGHVPLAIGSQTNGSTIRPASFCGIYGYKPSSGIISRRGALETSKTLDQVGVFARDLGDIALLADTMAGYDQADGMSYLGPKPGMLDGFNSEPPVEPSFAYFDMPYSDQYSSSVSQGMEELLQVPGLNVERLPAPQSFSVLIEAHKVIHHYEIFRALEEQRTQFSDCKNKR